MAEGGLPAFLTTLKKFMEEKIKEEVEELEAKVVDLENQIAELKAEGSGVPKVMFNACRRKDGGDSGKGFLIDFEDVNVNHGNAFDGVTFTAPVAGLYMFTFVGTSSAYNSSGSVEVKKNGGIVYDIYDGNETNNYNQLGATFHLALEVGDEINLNAFYPVNNSSIRPTTFSGRLIFQDE